MSWPTLGSVIPNARMAVRKEGTAFTVGRSLRLGMVRGIVINVHPSFALVLLWVLYQWGISAGAGVAGMLFGTLVLLAVFACVLLHELAHALVALRYGLRVRDITLLPIGGVARIEQTALLPKAEAAIALAGPVLNLLIAALLAPFVILVAAMRDADNPLSVILYANELSPAGFLLYLWVANILLAVFNLLPAFPMDGGRVLRAWLSTYRTRLTATRVAVAVGQVMAVALAIGGVLVGDYLMPLVSAFILFAAWTEGRHVRIEATLRRLEVGQFALWDAGGVGPDEPLSHAIKGGPRDLVVTQGSTVVGMLWRSEILKHLNDAQRGMVVRDLMDRRFNAVEAGDSVYDVHLWMQAADRTAVPVVIESKYRGIFTSERLAHVYAYLGQSSPAPLRLSLSALLRRGRPAAR
jgi:Zn-dependent protease